MAKSVLIVDDDETFQFYMDSLFKKYPDVEIFKAYDGKEALNIIATMPALPNIIFLDLNMPIMTGYEFLEVWTEKFNISKTRIVIVSSSDMQEDKDKTQKYESVKDYVVKPDIAEKIGAHVEHES